jgi:hypothetical protein
MLNLNYENKFILQNAIAAFEKQTNFKIHTPNQEGGQTNIELGYNAILQILGPERKLTVGAVIKKIDRFQTLNAFQEKNNNSLPILVVAPYITREIAQKCRSLNIQFIDTAGNAYINNPGFLINIIGQPRPAEQRILSARNTITPAGMRVVFAILTNGKLIHSNYREIAYAAGVSLGTIGNVLADLENRGLALINSLNEKDRRILDMHRLIDEWVAYYPGILRPKLKVRRFSATMSDWWQHAQLDPQKAVWGGEAAAAALIPNFKPAIITLYVSGEPDEIIIRNRLQLDFKGNIEMLEMFWKNGNERSLFENAKETAPPLLVYADLMATADSRDREVAKQIYDKYMANIDY